MASDDQILSESMQSEQRKPTYQVLSASPYGTKYLENTPYGVKDNTPKDVDPDVMYDEGFALIETEFGYGAPASAPGMRKIVVGDSLPEGEVTEITADGIRVIPDEGPEFIIPLGGRQGYTPPVREKKPTITYLPPIDIMSSLDFVDPFYREEDAGEYGRETAKRSRRIDV